MQNERYLNNAVLFYFLLLILVVIFNMLNNIDVLDIVYLVALISGILKYYIILQDCRK